MKTTTADNFDHVRSATRDATADASTYGARLADAARDEFEALASDAEHLLKSTADAMGSETASARARLKQTLSKAKDRLSAGVAAVSDQAGETAKATDGFVRDNPWQAIGLVAVAGLAVGMLISRR